MQHLSGTIGSDLAHSYFSATKPLRDLTYGVSLLNQGELKLLGSLARLETLKVTTNGERLIVSQSSIPNGSFSKLRRLSLIDIDIDGLVGLLGLNPLMRHLNLISLCLGSDWNKYGEQLFSDIVPLVLKRTPSLRGFSCDI